MRDLVLKVVEGVTVLGEPKIRREIGARREKLRNGWAGRMRFQEIV